MNDLLPVVAEARRRRILQLIWDRELSAGEIAEHLPVSFAAVSQHLAKLREAGLVHVRKEGRHRYYRARKGHMGTLAVYLESMWSEKLVDLKRIAEEKEARNEEN